MQHYNLANVMSHYEFDIETMLSLPSMNAPNPKLKVMRTEILVDQQIEKKQLAPPCHGITLAQNVLVRQMTGLVTCESSSVCVHRCYLCQRSQTARRREMASSIVNRTLSSLSNPNAYSDYDQAYTYKSLLNMRPKKPELKPKTALAMWNLQQQPEDIGSGLPLARFDV